MTSKNTFLDIEDSERPNDFFGRFLLKIVTYLAICGGIVLVIIVLINFVSIAGRTMFGKPLTGDFELVEMGCAVVDATSLTRRASMGEGSEEASGSTTRERFALEDCSENVS